MDTTLERLELDVDGGAVAGTLLAPARRVPGILFVHGWGGSQRQDLMRAREVAGLGCVCLTFDLRGHERTADLRETVSREQNLRDLLDTYDWLSARPEVDAQRMAVVGISYGGYLATVLTTMRPVRWLALRSAALYPDEEWSLPKSALHRHFDLKTYRRQRLQAADNRALDACARFAGDALVVAAERDEIVPRTVTESYVAALAARARSLTLRVIPEADHALTARSCQQAYTRHLVTWLTEMVVETRREEARARVSELLKQGGA